MDLSYVHKTFVVKNGGLYTPQQSDFSFIWEPNKDGGYTRRRILPFKTVEFDFHTGTCMNFPQVMQERINTNSFASRYAETNDCIFYHPDGISKIAFDIGTHPYYFVGQSVDESLYNSIGISVGKSYSTGWITEEQAMNSLFWRVVLRDQNEVPKKFAIPGLHKEVVHWVFAEMKQKFREDKAMGIYFLPYLDMWRGKKFNAPLMPLSISSLEDKSCVGGEFVEMLAYDLQGLE